MKGNSYLFSNQQSIIIHTVQKASKNEVIKFKITININTTVFSFFCSDRCSDERVMRSQANSSQPSRLSNYSARHFDFLDTRHSVFSRNSYYNDKLSMHPWLRRPCSRYSGIPFSTLHAAPCSARTDELARPRIKRERLIRQGYFIDNFKSK